MNDPRKNRSSAKLSLHLASYSSVAFSWKDPVKSFQNNTNIFLNVLEAVRSVNPGIRILSIGSSEEYGDLVGSNSIFHEEDILNPISPYAVARVSQEMLSKVYAKGYGLDIVMTRSFNHIGPEQKEIFVIASFAKRLVEMKKRENASPKLITGDISLIRDFVDVRDVVRAYDGLLKKGRKRNLQYLQRGRIFAKGTHSTDVFDSGYGSPDRGRLKANQAKR